MRFPALERDAGGAASLLEVRGPRSRKSVVGSEIVST
jgi:hypothetical protein